MIPPDWRLLRFTLRTVAFGLLWGLLWAWGYSPADYPVRLAVRAFGDPVATLNSGSNNEGGIIAIRTITESGDVIKDLTSASAHKVRGGKRFLALDVPGLGPVYRLAVGFPFGTVDRYVTAVLAFVLIWTCFPEFLGSGNARPRERAARIPLWVLRAADIAALSCAVLGPLFFSDALVCVTAAVWLALRFAGLKGYVEFLPGSGNARPRDRAVRIPLWVLRAADIAALSCVVLGPFLYSAAQVCVTAAVWSALRFAGFKGYVEFIELLPPASEPPRLSLPGSEDAPVRGIQRPQRKTWSFLAHTTPEGWSRLPAGAVAVGLSILAVVQARNRLVSVPEPGYLLFGLSLPLWQAVGWGLLLFAAFVATWEFLSAWRRTDNA